MPVPLLGPVEVDEEQSIKAVVILISDFITTSTAAFVHAISSASQKNVSEYSEKNQAVQKNDNSNELLYSEHLGASDDWVPICEAIYVDLQLQMTVLNSAIGVRWRTEPVLKIILSRSLLALEDGATSHSLRAGILDSIFDIFGSKG